MSKMAQGTTEKKGRETKKIPLKPIIAAAAVLVLIILIMAIEAVNTEKLIIKNDTSEDIEWIQLYFENTEEDSYDILTREAGVSVASGEKYSGKFKAQPGINPYGSFLMIQVKFAGRETAETYAGYFTRTFTGKIKIEFSDAKENGIILMKIKAGDGIFQSTKFTDCDEVQELFGEM
ncbi:MAG: hypothetical protein K2N94_12380 [Lachnospiraceae bacterium]|nr:hypothetical protein [Lachnospiraceae bacterium]